MLLSTLVYSVDNFQCSTMTRIAISLDPVCCRDNFLLFESRKWHLSRYICSLNCEKSFISLEVWGHTSFSSHHAHKMLSPISPRRRQLVFGVWAFPLRELVLIAHTFLLTYVLAYLLTYLLTYQPSYSLTPWNRVLLEKLTSSQQVKKFPMFYGTWRFITVFTRARHLSLSWVRSVPSMLLHSTSWRSILIFSSHLCLGLPSSLIPTGCPT